MSERSVFSHILKTKTGDSLVLVVTFLLTVFINLTVAVEIGLILAVVIFTMRMSDIMVTVKALPNPNSKNEKVVSHIVTDTHDCPQFSIYNVEGPLFFGAAQTFEQSIMNTINYKPKVLLFRMGKVPFMDTTGATTFSTIVQDFSRQGIVLISGTNPQPRKVLDKTGITTLIGERHFFEHTGEAINYALTQLDENKCLGCRHYAFNECVSLSGVNKVTIKKNNELST